MFDEIKSELKKINPKSPIFIGIVGVFSIFFIYLIFAAINSRSQQQQESTTHIYTPPPGPTPTLTPGKDFVEGQIVVKFKEGVYVSIITQDLAKYNASIKSRNPAINSTVVTVPLGQEENVRQGLIKDGLVQYAEHDFVIHAQFVPNDTNYANQWGFANTGQNIKGQTGTPQDDIKTPAAWDVTKGAGVKVAVLDTGIDLNHPEFTGKIAAQQAFITSSIDDKVGHGTHTAGIVAADTNNSQGIAGTCPDCALMIVKVLDDNASGPYSVIAQGITWAADNGAKVISMSLAGTDASQEMQDAVNYAWNKGVVVIAAAGNCGDSNYSLNGCSTQNPKEYPGALTRVVSVAATDNKDLRASFSNYGAWVTVAAPGKNIFSTLPTHSYLFQNSHGLALNYDYLSGTSMAAPMVAGVAGLIWSTPYGTSNQAVVDRLASTADKIEGTGSLWQNGRINAAAAVGSTSPVLNPTATPTPPLATPTFVCEGSINSICSPTTTPTPTLTPTTTVSPTLGVTPPLGTTPTLTPKVTMTPTPNSPCLNPRQPGFIQGIRDWIQKVRQTIRDYINAIRGNRTAPRPAPPKITPPCIHT